MYMGRKSQDKVTVGSTPSQFPLFKVIQNYNVLVTTLLYDLRQNNMLLYICAVLVFELNIQ